MSSAEVYSYSTIIRTYEKKYKVPKSNNIYDLRIWVPEEEIEEKTEKGTEIAVLGPQDKVIWKKRVPENALFGDMRRMRAFKKANTKVDHLNNAGSL